MSFGIPVELKMIMKMILILRTADGIFRGWCLGALFRKYLISESPNVVVCVLKIKKEYLI